ncbi:cytoplasmic protein [Bacillus cereus VD184]|jgi:hypothetical protein|uniref:Cytoplasmic protein n=1 Tax=Bacillus cereus VD184 TaxID=1053242 RepID=A0A9W5R6H4_BACCE|nr:cytoplasmic protein [Bacillus cereus VD184]
MEIKKVVIDGINIALIRNDKVLISDVQSALDTMATVQYEVDAKHIIIHKSLISEDFFDLKRYPSKVYKLQGKDCYCWRFLYVY